MQDVIDLRAGLPAISAPTLITAGRDDFICGPAWAEMRHEAIPCSHLTILPDCGHFAQIEQPTHFWAISSLF